MLFHPVPRELQNLLLMSVEESCALGNLPELLSLPGEPGQLIPSRQTSFAHSISQGSCCSCWVEMPPSCSKRFTSKPSKMQLQTASTARLLYMGFVLKHGYLIFSFLPILLSSAHRIPICGHISLFSMSLLLFPLWLMLLTSISCNLILLLLQSPNCVQSWFSL